MFGVCFLFVPFDLFVHYYYCVVYDEQDLPKVGISYVIVLFVSLRMTKSCFSNNEKIAGNLVGYVQFRVLILQVVLCCCNEVNMRHVVIIVAIDWSCVVLNSDS